MQEASTKREGNHRNAVAGAAAVAATAGSKRKIRKPKENKVTEHKQKSSKQRRGQGQSTQWFGPFTINRQGMESIAMLLLPAVAKATRKLLMTCLLKQENKMRHHAQKRSKQGSRYAQSAANKQTKTRVMRHIHKPKQ